MSFSFFIGCFDIGDHVIGSSIKNLTVRVTLKIFGEGESTAILIEFT